MTTGGPGSRTASPASSDGGHRPPSFRPSDARAAAFWPGDEPDGVLRARRVNRVELDPVVGCRDLAGERRFPEPDVEEADEAPAGRRAADQRVAHGPRWQRRAEDQVGQLALERHARRDWRPECDGGPVAPGTWMNRQSGRLETPVPRVAQLATGELGCGRVAGEDEPPGCGAAGAAEFEPSSPRCWRTRGG